MRIVFTKQFHKDIGKIKNKELALHVEQVVLAVKNASSLADIAHLKKLKGRQNAYRIRVGDYRIGVFVNRDIVEFACFLNRKDIYKYFP